MTYIHTKFFSSIIHIFESARNPLHFFPEQESRMSDTVWSIARSERV